MSDPYHTQQCTCEKCHCIQDHDDWVEGLETPTTAELIWFWGVVIVAWLFTIAIACGIAGYLWVKFN